MSSTFDSFVKKLQDTYKNEGITFDDSYIPEVYKYVDLILTTPKFAHWDADKKNAAIDDAISKITRIAVDLTRERYKNIIDASLFKEARRIFERKWKFLPPMPDPDQL
jgi:hypothetical protein